MSQGEFDGLMLSQSYRPIAYSQDCKTVSKNPSISCLIQLIIDFLSFDIILYLLSCSLLMQCISRINMLKIVDSTVSSLSLYLLSSLVCICAWRVMILATACVCGSIGHVFIVFAENNKNTHALIDGHNKVIKQF